MSSRTFEISVCSPPDRKLLVAEISYGERKEIPIDQVSDFCDVPPSDCETVAEISQEAGDLEIEIYARRSGKPWAFSFEEFVDALIKAKKRLAGSE